MPPLKIYSPGENDLTGTGKPKGGSPRDFAVIPYTSYIREPGSGKPARAFFLR